MLIHHRGDFGILERLMRHYMAPVTGGITDRQQNWFILLACETQRFFTPRIPVDGVLSVLL